LLLRTAFLFVRSAVRLVYAELPGPVAVCSPKQAHRELGDRVPGGDRIVEHRRVQRAPPPPGGVEGVCVNTLRYWSRFVTPAGS
jgi:hypothetical protein